MDDIERNDDGADEEYDEQIEQMLVRNPREFFSGSSLTSASPG